MLGFTELPSVAGKYRGKIAVLGSASCLWDDIRQLGEWPHATMAVNLTGCFITRRVTHWASIHGDTFPAMLELSEYEMAAGVKKFRQGGSLRHSIKPGPQVDFSWPGDTSGTSGLFATRVALALGYDEVMLCGVPMDGSGHFFDDPSAPRADFTAGCWEKYVHEFDGRVKSMSGNTRELLGGP